MIGLGSDKKKSSWNSHILNQNVNGDMPMNTDGVQPQFKRSQQSVNIHAISGITARDVCLGVIWNISEIELMKNIRKHEYQVTPLQRYQDAWTT